MEKKQHNISILQFGLINTSNVPWHYWRMLSQCGVHARMATVFQSPNQYQEDICLQWSRRENPWLRTWRSQKLNRWIKKEKCQGKTTTEKPPEQIPLVFQYHNLLEKMMVRIRDAFAARKVRKAIHQYNLNQYDIYHIHDGIEFTRDARWVQHLHQAGKKIVCNYHGMDLRYRGIVPGVDQVADLNLTNEFDLLALHPHIHYIPIPFRVNDYEMRARKNERLLVIHTPSIVQYKGTELIETVFCKVMSEKQVECKIVSGRSHREIIELKEQSDLAIEQVGNLGGTGYGVNSLENLCMGIPTITEFTPPYKKFLGEHPFALADKDTLYNVLIDLIDNSQKRKDLAIQGRAWVEKTHSYQAVFKRLCDLYRRHGIADLQSEREMV